VEGWMEGYVAGDVRKIKMFPVVSIRRFKEAEWKDEMTKVQVLEYLEGRNVVLLGIQRSQ